MEKQKQADENSEKHNVKNEKIRKHIITINLHLHTLIQTYE